MVSLQGIQKQRHIPGSSPQKKPLGTFSKIGVDLGIWVGVDFWDREKWLKICLKSAPVSGTKSPRFFAKIRARTRATKSEIHGEFSPTSSSLCSYSFWDCNPSSRTERPRRIPSIRMERVRQRRIFGQKQSVAKALHGQHGPKKTLRFRALRCKMLAASVQKTHCSCFLRFRRGLCMQVPCVHKMRRFAFALLSPQPLSWGRVYLSQFCVCYSDRFGCMPCMGNRTLKPVSSRSVSKGCMVAHQWLACPGEISSLRDISLFLIVALHPSSSCSPEVDTR